MARKPSLPKVEGQPWCAETKRWFRAWRDSPVTDPWDARAWQYLFDTALVHMAVWYDGDLSRLGELRARETQMGLAFDRMTPSGAGEGGTSGGGESTLHVIQGRRRERRTG